MDIQLNIAKIRDNPVLYKCNGMDSTNPYCLQPFNPNNIENNEITYYTKCRKLNIMNNKFDQINYYNNLCKNDVGNEYIFDYNTTNLDDVISCSNNEQKIRCKLNIFGDNEVIEHFDNNLSNKNLILVILFLVFLILSLIFS